MLSCQDLSSPFLEDNNDFHIYYCVICYENHLQIVAENLTCCPFLPSSVKASSSEFIQLSCHSTATLDVIVLKRGLIQNYVIVVEPKKAFSSKTLTSCSATNNILRAKTFPPG